MGGVGGWKGRGGVGVGNDEEAGTDSFCGHDWGFEVISQEEGVRGRRLACPVCTKSGWRTWVIIDCMLFVKSWRTLFSPALVEKAEAFDERMTVLNKKLKPEVRIISRDRKDEDGGK